MRALGTKRALGARRSHWGALIGALAPLSRERGAPPPHLPARPECPPFPPLYPATPPRRYMPGILASAVEFCEGAPCKNSQASDLTLTLTLTSTLTLSLSLSLTLTLTLNPKP